MLLLSTILLFSAFLVSQALDLHCQVAAGAKDWFVVYKLPGTTDNNAISKYLAAGNQDFMDSDVFTTNDAPLKKTLKAYSDHQTATEKAVMGYSNFPPHFAVTLPVAPAKGIVLMANGAKGSWIVHSLPNFVDVTPNAIVYQIQDPAGLAVCLTMKNADMHNIFPSLMYTGAIQYYQLAGTAVPTFQHPSIQQFVKGAQPTTTPFARHFQVKTDGDVSLSVFAKSGLARVDIYSRYMNILLRSGLKVRFNDDVRDALPNACNFANKVENIGGAITVFGQSIAAAQDGSVWAVTSSGMFCIGDSPRTQKHLNLGSSAVCIQEPLVVGKFQAIAGTSTVPSLIYTGAIQYYYVGGAQAVVFNDKKIQDFVQGAQPTSTPFARHFQLQSDNGVQFQVFAKSGLARVDIYSRYMNILLRSDLRVRFNDGVRDALPNVCSFANKVENIGGTITVGGTQITAAQDDSVWAVTSSGTLFCISDSPRTMCDVD